MEATYLSHEERLRCQKELLRCFREGISACGDANEDMLFELIGRGHGETAEDIVLEVIGRGKGWHGRPTKRHCEIASALLVQAMLEGKEVTVRATTAHALGELPRARWSVPALIRALADDASCVRANAAWSLGQLGSKRAVKPLIDLLIGEQTEQRFQLALAVDRARWNTYNFSQASRAQQENRVRIKAAEALGLLRDARAVDPLISFLKRRKPRIVGAPSDSIKHEKPFDFDLCDDHRYDHYDTDVLAKCIEALATIGDARPGVMNELWALLPHKCSNVSAAAASALHKLGDKGLVGAMIYALDFTSSDAHRHLMDAIQELGGSEVIEQLVENIWSESSKIRSAAFTLLGKLQAKEAVEPLLACLAQEEGEWLRDDIIRALDAIGDKRACPALFQAFQTGTVRIRQCALDALARIGDERAFDLLMDALAGRISLEEPHQHWEKEQGLEGFLTRCRAIDGLRTLKDPRATEPFIALLQDNSFVFKQRTLCGDVINGLGEFGDARAVEPLLRLLQTFPDVLESYDYSKIIDVLGKVGDPRAIEPLMALFEREVRRVITSSDWRDRYSSIPCSCAEALGLLGAVQAIPVFVAYLKDQSHIRWDIASYVIEALGRFGDVSTVPAIQWALRYDGNNILKLAPDARSRYRIWKVKEKAREAIACVMQRQVPTFA